MFTFNEYELDIENGILKRNGRKVRVEPQVFSVLSMLIKRHGTIVSRQDLLSEIWQDRDVSSGIIDSRIRSARLAIGDDGRTQRYIKTLTNQGFKFIGEVVETDATAHTSLSEPRKDREALASGVKPADTTSSRAGPMGSAYLLAASLAVVAALSIVFLGSQQKGGADTTTASSVTLGLTEEDSTHRQKAIAVLPTLPHNGNPQANTLSTEVAEETLAFLGGISSLNVVSRSASFGSQSRGFSPQEISDTLDVDFRVESRCRLMDDRVAVTVQLIRADDGIIIWSKRYTVPVEELDGNEQQITIARNVVQNVTNVLGVSSGKLIADIISPEAYSYYTAGLSDMQSITAEALESAIENLKLTILLEPEYLPAYAQLYEAYRSALQHTGMERSTALPEMQKLVRKMQILGPGAPETLTAEALLLKFDADDRMSQQQAITYLEKATRAGPNYALAHQEFGHALLGAHRYQDAVAAFEKAMIFNPVSANLLSGSSRALYSNDEFDAAFAAARRNIRWNETDLTAKTTLAEFLINSNRLTEVYPLIHEILRAEPSHYTARVHLATLYLYLGDLDKALEQAPSPPAKAYVAAAMGNRELALDYASEFSEHYFTKRALYLLGDSKQLYDHLTLGHSTSDVLWADRALTHVTIMSRVIEARLFRIHGDARAEQLIADAAVYFESVPLSEFRTVNQFASYIGLHILTGNLDAAIAAFDVANEKGYIFIYALDMPLLNGLKAHPGFEARRERMQQNARMVLEQLSAVPMQ